MLPARPLLRPILILRAARNKRTTIWERWGLFMCAHPKGMRAINEPHPIAGP